MVQALRDHQQAAGAEVAEVNGQSVVLNCGQDQQVNSVLERHCVVIDRTHWKWICLTGADRSTFLHNQSSNNINRLVPGQGCETVILTSTARTLDLATAYLTESEILLLVSPQRHQQLLSWFDRYIFFGDQVEVADVSAQWATFSVVGAHSQALLHALGDIALPEQPDDHQWLTIPDLTLRIAMGSGLATPGFTLMVAPEQATLLWQRLCDAGAVPMGQHAWETLRIQQGRPQPDAELTEDYNPLEAGLWHTISLDKGCYIGQETIARVNTYNAVKQQLWGLKLEAMAESGTDIYSMESDAAKVGVLTSVVTTPQGIRGLGYIKTKAGDQGRSVRIGETTGILIDVPFLSRSL